MGPALRSREIAECTSCEGRNSKKRQAAIQRCGSRQRTKTRRLNAIRDPELPLIPSRHFLSRKNQAPREAEGSGNQQEGRARVQRRAAEARKVLGIISVRDDEGRAGREGRRGRDLPPGRDLRQCGREVFRGACQPGGGMETNEGFHLMSL